MRARDRSAPTRRTRSRCSTSAPRPRPRTRRASCARSPLPLPQGRRARRDRRRIGVRSAASPASPAACAERREAWRAWATASAYAVGHGRPRAADVAAARRAVLQAAFARPGATAAPMSERDPRSVSLSLVSHTNAGKTTLARTLLGRDIGEVRDAPHVTAVRRRPHAGRDADGDALSLWDTPGFGDSARLARRLRQAEQPIGWFLSAGLGPLARPRVLGQRSRRCATCATRPTSCSTSSTPSRAIRRRAGYVAPEMELLGWIGKPVVVLLNQLGAPRAGESKTAEVARWRRHLGAVRARARGAAARRVRALLGAGADAARAPSRRLARGDQAALMARLRGAWRARRSRTFDAAMQRARRQPGAHRDDERGAARAPAALRARLRSGRRRDRPRQRPTTRRRRRRSSARRPARRRDAREHARAARLHGLGGAAEREIRARLAAGYELRLRLDETQAAMWGGAVTGALVGLKADLLSGGLTLGGGLIAGRPPRRARQRRAWRAASTSCAAPSRSLRHLERGRARHDGRGGAAAPCSRSRTSAAAAATGCRARRRRTGPDVVAAALAPLRERARRRLVGSATRQARAGRRCHTRCARWRRSCATRRGVAAASLSRRRAAMLA